MHLSSSLPHPGRGDHYTVRDAAQEASDGDLADLVARLMPTRALLTIGAVRLDGRYNR